MCNLLVRQARLILECPRRLEFRANLFCGKVMEFLQHKTRVARELAREEQVRTNALADVRGQLQVPRGQKHPHAPNSNEGPTEDHPPPLAEL